MAKKFVLELEPELHKKLRQAALDKGLTLKDLLLNHLNKEFNKK